MNPEENQIEATNESPGDPLEKYAEELWSVPKLLVKEETQGAWIIDGLLKRGGQMLLAAPPKSGKSLLASEIAVALSKPFGPKEERFLFLAKPHPESEFPGLAIYRPKTDPKSKQKPRKSYHVLFASLEMEHPEVADRIAKQLTAYRLPGDRLDDADDAEDSLKFPQLPLVHMFGVKRAKTGREIHKDLEIVVPVRREDGDGFKVSEGQDVKRLREIIESLDPDVIIFDTLIQLHEVNENDNILMKGVMRAVRKIASKTVMAPEVNENGKETGKFVPKRVPIAHIVLHHTRKENTAFKAPLSPDIMRGAGAVHGVADLVMLARQSYNKGELEIHISSRSSSIPNFFLRRNKESLVHVWQQPKARETVNGLNRKMEIFRKVLLEEVKRAGKGGLKINQPRLRKALELAGKKEGVNKVDVGPDMMKKRIAELWQLGFLEARHTSNENRRKNAAFNFEHWRLFPVKRKGPEQKKEKRALT